MGDISFQYPDALQALERAMAIRCTEFTLELVHLQILSVGFHPTDAWGKRPMKPGQIDTFGGRFAVRYSSPHLAPVVRERGLFELYI